VRFNFDGFVLDTSARELRGSKGAVHLSPKAFELLQTLLERRPGAISKADLHALLWHDTFVTDTSLATLVSEVRGALADDARRPRYVRTVHAYGYAFCGRAVSDPDGPGSAAPGCWLEWEGRKYPLVGSEHIIGRSGDARVVVDLPEVSRRHARITLAGDRAILDDLNSRNGTFVGDRKITAAVHLRDGDEIRIGPARLTFHVALRDATTKAFLPSDSDL
jgi:DNA-binding winged helix-turn-helix (wHTH) protein